MKRLYHTSIDPAGRAVRLALGEKQLVVDMVEVPTGKPIDAVARLAPGASGVAYVDQGPHGRVAAIGGRAILEYLEETDGRPKLLPGIEQDRAEARRICQWVDDQFYPIAETLLADRIAQAASSRHTPDSTAMRKGAHALRGALTFLNALAESRPYLAGRSLTLADLVAAGHLSAYDYFGDVQWDMAPDLRAWYARIKSRPSFRPLLEDVIGTSRPAGHYANLDF